MNFWSFSHARDHEEIAQAVQQQFGITLPTYQVDPMVFTNDSMFFLRNQSLHNDMLAVVGVAGVDLSSIDFGDRSQVQAWLFTHFLEHRDTRAALGI